MADRFSNKLKRWAQKSLRTNTQRPLDPKARLEASIRKLNDQIPHINEQLATVKASLQLLQKDRRRYLAEIDQLEQERNRLKSKGKKTEIETIDEQIAKIEQLLPTLDTQIAQAERDHEKALQYKEAFKLNRRRTINQAAESLRQHEQSKYLAEVAELIRIPSHELSQEQFQAHKEQLQKLMGLIAEEIERLQSLIPQIAEEIERYQKSINEITEKLKNKVTDKRKNTLAFFEQEQKLLKERKTLIEEGLLRTQHYLTKIEKAISQWKKEI